MLASLAVALLAAFLAMVGKQMYSRLWLDVILSHERCGSPRLGYEGVCLSRIMEYCPFALQVSLLLFARGIYQYMTPSYSFLLDVSVLFYLGVVTATAFSYGRAFHSQEQVMLYDSWKKATHQIVSASLLVPITILDLFQVLSSTTLRLRKMREDFVASAARRLGQIAVLMARNFKRWSEQNDPRPLQVVSVWWTCTVLLPNNLFLGYYRIAGSRMIISGTYYLPGMSWNHCTVYKARMPLQ